MIEQEMLSELVNGLLDIFGENLMEVILYGSVARGEEGPESDIDVAVLINNSRSSKQREKFIDLATDLDLKYGKVLSIVDIEQEKLEKWGQVLPFYRNVREEGIVLWKTA